MIGLPFNDRRCLGQVTEVVAELVATGDVVLARLAEEHETIDALKDWIRSLPQRDDLGDDDDGPRVDACDPPQRLRLPAPNPNCLVMWSRPLCRARRWFPSRRRLRSCAYRGLASGTAWSR